MQEDLKRLRVTLPEEDFEEIEDKIGRRCARRNVQALILVFECERTGELFPWINDEIYTILAQETVLGLGMK
jgi:hypothetical protein